LDSMNFDVMKGRAIRIMWSQRDPSLRKSGVGNVFIKNLHKDIDQKSLYDTFSAFGNILSCKIAQDEHGVSKGYGFVHFESEESARNAISKVNGMLLNDKKVFVGAFMPRKERSHTVGDVKFTNCFVKNFGEDMTDEKLHEMFSNFGEITSAKVMQDESSRSKGFGFVCFREAEEAEIAANTMNGMDYGGRQLYVGRAQKKNERQAELRERFERQKQERMNRYQQGVNLYVKNLDDNVDDEKLKSEFSVFGNITSAKVMTDSNGRSKGFGFVCFSNPEEATKAVTEMNGKIVVAKPLYVALAQRKEDRKAHLANQYMQRLQQFRIQGSMQGAFLPQTGYFVPTMPPQPQRFFAGPAPSFNTGQIRQAQPRWTNAAPQMGASRAGAAGFVPGSGATAAMRPTRPAAPQQVTGVRQGTMNARPITGQQPAGGAPPTGAGPQAAGGPRAGVPSAPVPLAAAGGPAAAAGRPAGQPVRAPNQQSVLASGAAAGLKFTPNMRNAPAGQPNAAGGAVPAAGGVSANGLPNAAAADAALRLPNQEPLTTSMLANAPPQEQKQMLGERLFPLVHDMFPNLAGKITGMLLEIDNAELLHMLESQNSLKAKIDEAVAVLHAHQVKSTSGPVANSSGIVQATSGSNGSAGPTGTSVTGSNPTADALGDKK